jgi:hypothetical protein
MRGRLSILAGVFVFASLAVGQTADPFEAKVRALSHPKYAEREKTARDLIAAGEPALKALKAAQTSTDEELSSRATAVVAKIERAVRSQRLLVAPTLALKFDKVSLDKAVTELAQKTGLRFMVDGTKIKDVKRPITLDTGDVPFWDAVQAFYRAAGLSEDDSPQPPQSPMSSAETRVVRQGFGRVEISSSYMPGGQFAHPAIRLIDGTHNAPAITGQAFRVRALPAGFTANKYDDIKGELTLHLDIDAVPAMSVVEILGIEVRKAIADDRRVLAITYPAQADGGSVYANDLQIAVAQRMVIIDEMASMDFNNSSGTHYAITLKTGGSRPKQLAELHGIVVARIIAPPEPLLTVSDIFGKGRGQTVRTEGLTCEVLAKRPPAVPLAQSPEPPRIVGQPPAPPSQIQESATPRGPTESFVVRIVSSADETNDMLNVPIRMKGRVQQFIRINRRGGPRSFPTPNFEVRNEKGLPIRIVNSQVIDSNFDGSMMSQDVRVTIERPVGGLDGISLTFTARRPATVEMPFVLKDLPLP